MSKALFILIAFIIGELVNVIFLLPIMNDLYEPFIDYAFAVRSLVWVLIYLILPMIIGAAIEGAVIVFLERFKN